MDGMTIERILYDTFVTCKNFRGCFASDEKLYVLNKYRKASFSLHLI